MTESNRNWLVRKTLEECGLQFRTGWDIYIKWHTVFLTINIAGLGITAQHLHGLARIVVAVAFVAQNFTSLLTAILMAHFSRSVKHQADEAASWLAGVVDSEQEFPETLPSSIVSFPIPAFTGFWCGYFNAVGGLFLAICWIAVAYGGK